MSNLIEEAISVPIILNINRLYLGTIEQRNYYHLRHRHLIITIEEPTIQYKSISHSIRTMHTIRKVLKKKSKFSKVGL